MEQLPINDFIWDYIQVGDKVAPSISLGYGEIGIGNVASDTKGAITFTRLSEPQEIGSTYSDSDGKLIFGIVFMNTQSIDVLLGQLQQLKQKMMD